MMKSVFTNIIVAFVLLISFSLQAKNPSKGRVSDTETELSQHLITFQPDSTINLQEIVVKAFRSDKRLRDTPGSIGIITNRQLLREPAFTLAPSVNKIAGVWMQSGSMNTNRLTIRGIGTRSPYGSNKIRAYYGDIPLTNGVGETTLEDLDMEQISDIEIIKGPSSGFYGSGLGGVLLFNPTKPTKDQLAQQVSVGSFKTIKYTGKLAVANQNAGHSLVYSRIHSDGYRENNETDRHNLTWTSSVTKNHTSINLLAAFIKMDAYIPSSINLKTYQETPEKAAANWAVTRGYEDYRKVFGGISVQQTFSKNWQAKLSTFAQTNQNNELRPFNILQEKNHYFGFRSVAEKKYTSEKITSRLILGNEFFTENYQWQTLQNKNRVAGNLLTDNVEFRWYNNIFFLADLNFQERVQLLASLNLNRTSYRYEDHFLSNGDQGGKHQFNPVVSPRLAANWKSSEKLSIFAVVSHGFSPPTLEETLMPGGLRNTAIKPETGWNFEVGAKGSVSESLWFEISAYYMKVKNLLVARRTAEDEYMGINAGSTNHPGLEIKLDYRLIQRPEWSSFFRINANLTRYRFAEFMDNGINYSGNKLTGTPASTTNWMLETIHSKTLFLNLHVQTVGRMPMRDDNTLFTDAYQLANLMAGYEKSFRKLSVSLSSGVQNILDQRYASMVLINATAVGSQAPRYYYPGLPRNYKTMISLKYSF
ncbi:MAG: TonB-dependent receptor [Bacteroidota bacterium]|nr:TonB-dependent receptor [Odoribacter sp.]MDP3643680.1 TonB-dependent receptor [Bacteroidota bacterium]